MARKKYNTYEFQDEYVIGYTSKGEKFYFDLEDYDIVKDHCWYIDNKSGYVETHINNKRIRMHRLILDVDKNDVVDHIHGKESRNDNRKNNLRKTTQAKNMINIGVRINNKSGVTGVYFDKDRNKWSAQISINKKTISLGRFNTFDDAVKVRKEAEKAYFGEYSYDNSQNMAI